jgi:hypothetical protein
MADAELVNRTGKEPEKPMANKVFAVVVVLMFATLTARAETPVPQQGAAASLATSPTPASTMTQQQTTAETVAPTPAATPAPAPMRIGPGSRLFVESTQFGMALSAAILKKKVPVVAVTDRSKADFFVQTVSDEKRAKSGEKIVRFLFTGGSGDRFNATVTIVNSDGAIVFAHNSKKENFQSAAENIAKNLKKHIEGE